MASVVSAAQLISHLVLPPRLPSDLDIEDEELAPDLTNLAIQSVTQLKKLVGDAFIPQYDRILQALTASRALQTPSGLTKAALLNQLDHLGNAKTDVFLFVSVAKQNGGLLLWRKAEYVICQTHSF